MFDDLTTLLLDFLSDQPDVTAVDLSSSNENMTEYLLMEAEDDLESYVSSQIVAVELTASLRGLEMNGLFQYETLHSSPLALNTITNMLFR